MKIKNIIISKILLLLVVLSINGCATNFDIKTVKSNWQKSMSIVSNGFYVEKSDFDDTLKYRIDRAPVFSVDGNYFNGPKFYFTVVYTKSMGNNILLGVKTEGIHSIRSVSFNIDGKVRKFNKFVDSTDISLNDKESSRWFKTNMDFVRKLLNSKTAKIKYSTRTGYETGDFRNDGNGAPYSAINALRGLMVKIGKLNN